MSHMRAREDQRRARKLAEHTGRYWYCSSGAYWDEDKGFYRRYYYPEDRRRCVKWCATRKARRQQELYQRGAYRRLYDFWWELD